MLVSEPRHLSRASSESWQSTKAMLNAQRELGALELTVETGEDVLDVVDAGVEDELTLVEDDLQRGDEDKADVRSM